MKLYQVLGIATVAMLLSIAFIVCIVVAALAIADNDCDDCEEIPVKKNYYVIVSPEHEGLEIPGVSILEELNEIIDSLSPTAISPSE